jgi:peptidoglycan/LPS O-acetylase OafA/YrhL
VTPKRAGKVAFVLAMVVTVWRTFEGHFDLFPGVLIPSSLLSHTDARVDALLWGCIAAIYFPEIKRYVEAIRLRQLWLPIGATILFMVKLHAPGLLVLKGVLIPALILSTVIYPASLLGRALEWQPLRWIGTISYSLYLWQEIFLPPLASEKALGVFHYVQQPPWNVLAILASGCLSRYLIELPMSRLGHRLTDTVPQGTRLAIRLSPRSCL